MKYLLMTLTLLLAQNAFAQDNISPTSEDIEEMLKGLAEKQSKLQSIFSSNGKIRIESNFDFAFTVGNIAAALEDYGMLIVNEVDRVGNTKNREILLLSHPTIEAELINCDQGNELVLPIEMLIARDSNSDLVYIEWDDPIQLKSRLSTQACDTHLDKLAEILSGSSTYATRPKLR